MHTFKIIIKKDTNGEWYIAEVPSLQYCLSYGDTKEEALVNIQEAIEGVIETMQSKNIPMPIEQEYHEYVVDYNPNNKKLFRNIYHTELSYV